MNALLIIAHGSRLKSSNEEVLQRMAELQHDLKEDYHLIAPAFLEFASPTIAQAVDYCLEQGASHLTVLPYFLAAGKHVNQDIPAQTRHACDGHGEIALRFLPHIGSSDKMRDLMGGLARNPR